MRLTANTPSYWHGVSPDGKTIVYCAERGGNYDVYAMSSDGGAEIRLTDAEGLDDGPEKIMSIADLKLWKDGRDSFDIINAVMNYKTTENHNAFHVVTRVNLTDGEGKGPFGIKLIGTEGVIESFGNDLVVKTLKRRAVPGYGGYDSFDSFSNKQKEEFKKWYQSEYGNNTEGGYDIGKESKFEAPANYDDRLDHMIVFFNAIRTGSKIYEDASFGLRAAAPAIACNLSAQQNKPILWDPIGMRIV